MRRRLPLIENVALQLGLTVLFAAAAVYYLVPAVTANPLSDRVDAVLHAVAGLAMVAMLWPWGMAIPPMAGVVVFTCAAAWFAVKAALGRENPYSHWYHGAMMASMIVMWVFMTHLSPTTAGHSAAMDPMAMGGADMQHHHVVASPSAPWMEHTSLALGVAYLLATACFAVVVWRTRGAGHSGAGTVMAAGMAAFFLATV